MAAATVCMTTVKKMVEVEAQEKIVALTLSYAEAQTLTQICAVIGGSPKKSARKHVQEIIRALGKCGFVWNNLDRTELFSPNADELEFKEGSDKLVEGA